MSVVRLEQAFVASTSLSIESQAMFFDLAVIVSKMWPAAQVTSQPVHVADPMGHEAHSDGRTWFTSFATKSTRAQAMGLRSASVAVPQIGLMPKSPKPVGKAAQVRVPSAPPPL